MKKSPDESKLEERLRPSIISGGGFLGEDERDVSIIISEDLEKMEKNHIDKSELVELLKRAYRKTKERFGQKVQLADKLVGQFFEAKGKIPSPFIGDGVFEKGEARIKDLKNDRELIITALSINLIEKHDFFQGKGSRYRIDPVKAYNTLKEMND